MSENVDEDAGRWEDWEEQEGTEAECICLFCPRKFRTAETCLGHCSTEHGFDFSGIKIEKSLDFYGSIKVINFIRRQVISAKCITCDGSFGSKEDLLNHMTLNKHFILSSEDWKAEEFLTPVIENDGLLFGLEMDDSEEDEAPKEIEGERSNSSSMLKILSSIAANELSKEEGKIALDEETLNALKLARTVAEDEIQDSQENEEDNETDEEIVEASELQEQIRALQLENERLRLKLGGKKDVSSENVLDSEEKSAEKKKRATRVAFGNVQKKEMERVDSSYFSSYGAFGIHREMLGDKVRTDAYRDALTLNPSLIKNAVVVDVGCGTGILSLFAAKAGASKVVAVDASHNIIKAAEKIAQENGYLALDPNLDSQNTKQRIHFVESKAEDFVAHADSANGSVEAGKASLAPIQPGTADVVVSEWMGYCLHFESMLPSVLAVRDKFLKPGGAVLPDLAKMYLAGFGRGATSLPFWENVYGFNMESIGKAIHEDSVHLPIVDVISPHDVITEPFLFKTFDMAKMEVDDVDFTAEFLLSLPQTDTSNPEKENPTRTVHCFGLVVWFDVEFSSRFCKDHSVTMSTSPLGPRTHWAQTLLTLEKPVVLQSPALKDDNSFTEVESVEDLGTDAFPGKGIKGRISIVRSKRHRSIDISLETSVFSCGFSRTLPTQLFEI